MLELQAVSKKLGDFAISGLDLSVAQGEYFVLLGPSGAGKTVLLEIIAGLTRPDSGAILWQGKDITNAPPEARGFALVYQDYALFPHMTVAANIAYGLKAKGKAAEEGVRSAAKMLDIPHLLERGTVKLSGGEKQRVALARALAAKPQMLLLDEPLNAIDANVRLHVRRELKRIHRETGTTFLHVTHDTDEALYLGEQVGVMLDGRIQQAGTPEELFRRPSNPEVAGFLGMRNILPAEYIKPGLCRAGELEVHVASADESISHVWIKPEEILLSRQPFDSSARNQFRCSVEWWEHSGVLLAVRLSVVCEGAPPSVQPVAEEERGGLRSRGDVSKTRRCALELSALITHASFEELGIEEGAEVFCTFKSSAVHCF